MVNNEIVLKNRIMNTKLKGAQIKGFGITHTWVLLTNYIRGIILTGQ